LPVTGVLHGCGSLLHDLVRGEGGISRQGSHANKNHHLEGYAVIGLLGHIEQTCQAFADDASAWFIGSRHQDQKFVTPSAGDVRVAELYVEDIDREHFRTMLDLRVVGICFDRQMNQREGGMVPAGAIDFMIQEGVKGFGRKQLDFMREDVFHGMAPCGGDTLIMFLSQFYPLYAQSFISTMRLVQR